MRTSLHRRALLATAAGAVPATVAGCLDDDPSVDTSENGTIELYDHRIAEGGRGLTPVVMLANAGTDPVDEVLVRVSFLVGGESVETVDDTFDAPESGDVEEESVQLFSADLGLDETEAYTVELYVNGDRVDDGRGQMPD